MRCMEKKNTFVHVGALIHHICFHTCTYTVRVPLILYENDNSWHGVQMLSLTCIHINAESAAIPLTNNQTYI